MKMKMLSLLLSFILLSSAQLFAQKVDDIINEGITKFEAKEYVEAILLFNRAIERDANAHRAYFMRGNIKKLFEDIHGAMKDYNRAIEINPKFTEAYLERGNIKYILQDYYGAIDDFSKVINVQQNNVEAYFKRGQAKQQLEAYEDAINDCTKILEINPKNVDAYYLRGVLRIEYGQRTLGCLDLSKAGELGDLKAYEIIREKCNDRKCCEN
jgi:tetratricopeptide (TPR) repeat protein